MANDDAEQRRLGLVCGDLLGRGSEDIFTRQVARVLVHISCGRSETVRDPFGVVVTFRSKGLIPPTIVHLCRWHKRLSPSEALPQNGALAVAFAACLYPRRIFRLTDWERLRRFQCFLEVFRCPGLADAMAVITCLRACGRLPDGAANEQVLGLLSDMSAADKPEDQQERVDRLAGAALQLATHHAQAIERQVRGEEDRGILRYWADDGQFVRFLGTNIQHLPSLRCAHIEAAANGTPFWGGIQNALVQEFGTSQTSYIKKAVELEQMLWRRRPPDRITPEDFSILVANFWEDQHQKLIHGFPHYAFESHFVRWWQACAINLKNLILRTPRGTPVILPRPCAEKVLPVHQVKDPEDKRRQEDEARKLVLTPEFLRNMREGWRLIRTTFCAQGAIDHAADNETLRSVLDDLWAHHMEKDILQGATSETVKQIAARVGMNLNTAYTQVKRIGNRHIAYNLARLQGVTNHEIEHRLVDAGAELELLHLNLASLARPVDRSDTLFFAFAAHVFLHAQIDQMHPDPWSFRRLAEEFRYWADDPLFLITVSKKAADGGPLHRIFLAALVKLLNEPSGPFGASSDHPKTADKNAEDPLDGLQTQLLNALRRVNDPASYQDLSVNLVAWATALTDDVMSGAGLSVYLNLRSLFDLKVPRLGDHSEWIVPSWYLAFVEGLPLEAGQIVTRLIVDPGDEANVRRVVKSMRLHCNEQEARL